MAYSPIGDKVVLERLKIDSKLVNAYSGLAKVIAKTIGNDILSEGDIVVVPYEYQTIPEEDDLIVAKVDDIYVKKV